MSFYICAYVLLYTCVYIWLYVCVYTCLLYVYACVLLHQCTIIHSYRFQLLIERIVFLQNKYFFLQYLFGLLSLAQAGMLFNKYQEASFSINKLVAGELNLRNTDGRRNTIFYNGFPFCLFNTHMERFYHINTKCSLHVLHTNHASLKFDKDPLQFIVYTDLTTPKPVH